MERRMVVREDNLLMGATENWTLVFADIEVRTCNGYPEFSVSFNEVIPFKLTDEVMEEYIENFVESIDDSYKVYLLEQHDCSPSELVNELLSENKIHGYIEDYIDISLYPESYSIEGLDGDIYFESESCGQHDTRDYLIPIDKDFSDWLHEMWDKYHLKEVDERFIDTLKSNLEVYKNSFDERDWVQSWLEKQEW